MNQRRYRFIPDARYPVALQCVGSEVLRLCLEIEHRLIADAVRGGKVFKRIHTQDDYLQAVVFAVATGEDRKRQELIATNLLALIYGQTHD